MQHRLRRDEKEWNDGSDFSLIQTIQRLPKAAKERRLLRAFKARLNSAVVFSRTLCTRTVSLKESVERQYDHHRRMRINSEYLKNKGRLPECEGHAYRSRRLMVELLGSGEGMVLEVGCGGCEAFPLLQRKGLTPVGIDVYVPILKAAKRNLVVRAAMEYPPFKNDSFHAVYARHALEHTVSPKQTLGEINRILTSEGELVSVTPHYFPDPEPAHVTKLTQGQWETLLGEMGFKTLFCKRIMRDSLELTVLAQKASRRRDSWCRVFAELSKEENLGN